MYVVFWSTPCYCGNSHRKLQDKAEVNINWYEGITDVSLSICVSSKSVYFCVCAAYIFSLGIKGWFYSVREWIYGGCS